MSIGKILTSGHDPVGHNKWMKSPAFVLSYRSRNGEFALRYHRGLMVGETPNIDRIGNEGAIFMDYVAMQGCTSGHNAFFTGMYPLRTGMIPPQLPGSPSWLRAGTPALAVFLRDLGYTTGEFGKNHPSD